MTRRTGQRLAWTAIVLSVLLVVFSYGGAAMAGSFSISNPERIKHYQIAARVYLGLIILGLAVIAGAVLYLMRSDAKEADRPAT